MNSKKAKTIHRIKIIKGHINAIEKMVDKGTYCVDIIHQSLAVQKALKKLDSLIMEGHLKDCVIKQAKNGNEKKMVEELLSIYKYK